MQPLSFTRDVARLAIILLLAGLQAGCVRSMTSRRLDEEDLKRVAAEESESPVPAKNESTVDEAVERGNVAKEIRDVLASLQKKHQVPQSEIDALEQLLMESDPVLRATLLRQYQRILSGEQTLPPRESASPGQSSPEAQSNNPQQRWPRDHEVGYGAEEQLENPDSGSMGSHYASNKPPMAQPQTQGHITRGQSDGDGTSRRVGNPAESTDARVGVDVRRDAIQEQRQDQHVPSPQRQPNRSAQELSAAAQYLRSQQLNNLATSDPTQPLMGNLGGFGTNQGMTEVQQMLEQMAARVRAEELREASLTSLEADPANDLAAADPAQDPAPDPVEQKNWQEFLENSINMLEVELAAARKDNDQAKLQSLDPVLRMLYVCAGKREAAGREVAADSDSIKQFWRELALTLDTQINNDQIPSHRKELLVLRGLRDAVRDLSEQSRLDIRNLAFCQHVESFGRYTTFKKPYEFRAGQEVLLYVEIENMKAIDISDSSETKYEVSLAGHYDIFDAAGRRVAEHQFPSDAETCRNRRQDFYIPYRMYIPGNLGPGKYSLHLHMEDVHAQKIAESAPLEFVVN